MNFPEALAVAVDGVFSNKLRSFLTTLGVIIGVAAVIALVSVGEGASQLIMEQIESLGTNLLMINPASNRVLLTVEDADGLAARVPALAAVTPLVSADVTVKWGLATYDTTVQGVGSAFLWVRNYELERGRALTDNDVELNRRVALIGQTVLGELFKGRDPLGQELTVNGQRFEIVGVLREKGEGLGTDADDCVLVPVTAAQRLAGTNRLNGIFATLRDGDLASAAVAQIERIFERHFGRPDQVTVQSQDELLGAVNTATRTLSLMLGAIAGISLLVGGIGIMNIMLVSVTERTREIGVRKAVGARRADIMSQFLIESLVISLTGGVVGIALGSAVAQVIARFGGWGTAVSLSSVFISFGFAAAVGVGFGLYPAMKAARLDPISSLRYE